MTLRRVGGAFVRPREPNFTINRRAPQAKGLIGWWPMNLGRGPIVREYSGQNQHASFLGGLDPATAWVNVAGMPRSAVEFDNTNLTRVGLSVYPAFKEAARMTLSCWFYMTSAAQEAFTILIDHQDHIGLFMTAAPVLNGIVWSPQTNTLGSTTISANMWHHAAVTYDGANSRVYLDGVQDGSIAYATGLPTTVTNPIAIGDFFNSASNTQFQGYITDVRAYNRGLTADEVFAAWHPDTRWELYRPVTSRLQSKPFGPTIQVPLGTFSLTGFAPTVTAVDDTIIDVPSKAFSLTGLIPAIATGVNVASPAGSFTLTGIAPAVGTSVAVASPSKAFTLTAFAPDVATGASVAAPTKGFSLTGQVPSVGSGVSIAAPTKAFTLAGFVPTIATGANIVVPLKQYLLAGAAPTILARAWTKVAPAQTTWTKVTPVTTIWTKQ